MPFGHTLTGPNILILSSRTKLHKIVSKAPFGWRSGNVGGWKIVEGWKSRRMENILVFTLMCLVGGVEKWEDRKLFCLIGEKNGKDGKYNLCKLIIIPLLHNR